MEMKKRDLVLGIGAILWVFAITLGYYVTHKPFTPGLAGVTAQILWRMTLAGVIFSIAGGVGRRLICLPEFHPMATLSIQAALGLGLLSLAVMFLGLFGGFHAIPFALILLALAVIFWRDILAWWRSWKGLGEFWKESSRFWRITGSIAAFILLLGFLTALAPAVKYDALMYHLVMPQEYLRSGRLAYLPWLAMSGMPQATEMLYTLAMSLGGAQGAAVLGWGFAFLALVGLAGYALTRLDAPAGWVAVASLLAGYTFAISTAWAYVDWLGLYFGFAALVCLDAWRQGAGRKVLFFAGLFTGLAFSTKYTAGIFSIALFGAFCWHCFQKKDAFFANLGVLIGGAILAAFPWLARNWVNTGNPVYPFLFQGGAMDAVRIAVYQGLPAWGDWREVLLLPLRATISGSETAEGYSVSIGPLLLGLGGLAWIGRLKLPPNRHAALENAAWIGCLGILLWVAGNQASGYLIQTRMYFALFPAFAILAAFGFHGAAHLEIPGLRVGRVLHAVILLVLGLNAIEVFITFTRADVLPVMVGTQTEKQYRENSLGWYSPAADAILEQPEDQRTLLLYEPRGLYCLPNCDPDEILDRWKHDLALFNDPQAILASWRHQGFAYILYNKAGTRFLRENPDPHHPAAEIDRLEDLLSGLPLVQEFGSSYQLYRIPPQ